MASSDFSLSLLFPRLRRAAAPISICPAGISNYLFIYSLSLISKLIGLTQTIENLGAMDFVAVLLPQSISGVFGRVFGMFPILQLLLMTMMMMP